MHLQLLEGEAAEEAEAEAEAEGDTPEDTMGGALRTDTGSETDPDPTPPRDHQPHPQQFMLQATHLHTDIGEDRATIAGNSDTWLQNAEENRLKSMYSTGRKLDPGALEGTTTHHHLDLGRESKWII